jgi:hypothetical protein
MVARRLHARAELLRHMRSTAAKDPLRNNGIMSGCNSCLTVMAGLVLAKPGHDDGGAAVAQLEQLSGSGP